MKNKNKPEVFSVPQPSKVRIRLFDKEYHELSDRLVDQTTEFRMGPKEVHKGPISIEVNLTNQMELDTYIEYLKKLKGDLPIVEATKKDKATKTITKMLSEKEPLLDLIKTIKAKAKNQEQLIDMLRDYQFRFISGDVIQDMTTFDKTVGEQIQLRDRDIQEGFQYMVRLIKEAKEPMNDKYDFRLVFAIKIVGDKVEKVVIYLWGKYSEYIKIPWSDKKKVNFKKVEKIYSFPEFMDYVERKKWRTEHRKWQIATDNGKQPDLMELSKFYNKFKPYIKGYDA